MKELETDYLGTDKEEKIPPPKKQSWQGMAEINQEAAEQGADS